MGEFSLTHILFVLILFLLFFGPSKLPGLGQSLGKAIRNFKQSMNEIDAEYTADSSQSKPAQSSGNQQNVLQAKHQESSEPVNVTNKQNEHKNS